MAEEVLIGREYTHFKGGRYRVLTTASDADNPDITRVIYEQLYESEFPIGKRWDKILSEFTSNKKFDEDVEYNGIKFKAGQIVKRYVLDKLPENTEKDEQS